MHVIIIILTQATAAGARCCRHDTQLLQLARYYATLTEQRKMIVGVSPPVPPDEEPFLSVHCITDLTATHARVPPINFSAYTRWSCQTPQ